MGFLGGRGLVSVLGRVRGNGFTVAFRRRAALCSNDSCQSSTLLITKKQQPKSVQMMILAILDVSGSRMVH